MRLLILGASGDQGAAQVQAALAAGHSVKAACRRPPLLEHATSMEALEWVGVDYRQPTTLAPAMQGVNVVLANFPSSSFNDGPTLVRAAMATGVAAHAGIVYFTGVAVAAGILAWEHSLVSADDQSRLDAAFFNMNGILSVTFFLFVLAERVFT